ncbi:MAG TPA: DUF4827 family protein [Bacteroidales bacterium]|nr:DUF4827 family protein [Bacteroidales bacterium]
MRKIFSIAALLALLATVISSCNSSLTYANQLAEEKLAIKNYIKKNNLTIVDTPPTVAPWPTGVYYLTKSGLYVHVDSIGTPLPKPIQTNTVFTVRYVETNMDGEKGYSNMEGTGNPNELYYNNVSSSSKFEDCLAWHEGLDYVGDGGHIQMIVPASLGWSMYTSSSSLTAMCYDLRYTFWK